MERVLARVSVAEELAELDRLILGSVPGDEAQLVEWIQQRHRMLEVLHMGNSSPAEIEEMKARTNQLEEKFLHWRRASIMDLSSIDQHLRYLNEQQAGSGTESSARFDIRG